MPNIESEDVVVLLEHTGDNQGVLAPEARDALASLVLRNSDCRKHFFDLFMPPSVDDYTVDMFRNYGRPVAWSRRQRDGETVVELRDAEGIRTLPLRSPSEIKAVLYGIRYWARDELGLVDESYREHTGCILYPILAESTGATIEIVDYILSLTAGGDEWTTLSVQELIVQCCQKRRQPAAKLLSAIKWLVENRPGRIVLIPTSRSFATLTARSRQSEEFELRGYFRDTQGRYISHVRLHNSIRRPDHVS